MRVWLLLVVALLATQSSAQPCNSTQLEQTQPIINCSFPGYNLSALAAVDLYGTEGSQQYVYRFCGTVRDSLCPPNSTACRFNTNANVCNDPGNALSLMDTTAVQRFGYINNNASLGLSIIQVTPDIGSGCPNAMNRTIITNIQCASGPLVPTRITSISKSETGCTCSLTITISSPLACPSNRTMPIVIPTMPATRLPCTMGQFGIDLSSQFSEDLYLSTSPTAASRYVVNLCRPVRDIGCNLIADNGPAVAACVVPRCSNASATALMYSYTTPTWHYTNHHNNNDGYTMVNYISATAMVVVRLTCDFNSTSPQLVRIMTTAAGQHHIFLNTSLACVNETSMVYAQPKCNSTCCYLGYDFSALKKVDITAYQRDGLAQPWSFSMCNVVKSTCNGAMVCQKPTCSGGSWILAVYNPTAYLESHFSYVNGLDFTGGVRMVMNSGQYCGAISNPRSFIVEFICDPTAQFPRAGRAAEDATCVYHLSVRTTIVCAKPPFLGGGANLGVHNVTGNSRALVPVKPIYGCQFGGYDFSPLAQSDFHVKLDQYIFVTKICGEVDNVVCRTGNAYNSSVCQIDYSCSDTPRASYVVSLWNPGAVQYGYVEGSWENGVSMRLKTGDECGGDVPRSIIYNFVCDPDADIPYFDQGYESPGSYICNYFMRIRTNIVCKPPPALLAGNSTYSSSSTGRWWYPQPNDASTKSQSWFIVASLLMLFAVLQL